jgi:hypothetical protein
MTVQVPELEGTSRVKHNRRSARVKVQRVWHRLVSRAGMRLPLSTPAAGRFSSFRSVECAAVLAGVKGVRALDTGCGRRLKQNDGNEKKWLL